jgi:MFS family permease
MLFAGPVKPNPTRFPMAQPSATSSPGVAAPAEPTLVERGSGYLWVVLFASLLVQTTASFGNQAISPLAPFLLPDLDLSRSQLGLVVTAYYLGAVLMLTPGGWISDRLGVRTMFLVGLLGCGLPLVLGAQAPGLPLLMGAMLLSGLGTR